MKNQKAGFILLCITLIFFCSCSDQPNSDDIEWVTVKSKPLKLKKDLGYPREIYTIDSLLIIRNHSIGLINYFEIIDLKTNACLVDFGKKGKGPDEFLYPKDLFFNADTTKLLVFDAPKQAISSIDIQKLKQGSVDVSPSRIKTKELGYLLLKNVRSLRDNLYIAEAESEDGRFVIFDNTSRIISISGDYSDNLFLNQKLTPLQKARIQQGEIAINSSCSRVASITYYSDLMEIFSINDHVKRLSLSDVKYPINGQFKGKGPHKTYIKSRKSILGYTSIASTSEFIYCLFSKDTVEKHVKNNSIPQSKVIHVFDWNGNKIRNIELDIAINKLVINEQMNILIGLSFDPNPKLIYIELNICGQY